MVAINKFHLFCLNEIVVVPKILVTTNAVSCINQVLATKTHTDRNSFSATKLRCSNTGLGCVD